MFLHGKTLRALTINGLLGLAGLGLLAIPVNTLRAQGDGKKSEDPLAKANAELKKLQHELEQARADLEKHRAELERKAEALLRAAHLLRQLEEKVRSEKIASPAASAPATADCQIPILIPIYIYPPYQNYYRRPSYLPQLPTMN